MTSMGIEESKESYRDEFGVTEVTEMDTETINESLPDRLISNELDKPLQTTTYGETVLASVESLSKLPQEVLSILEKYKEGELPSTTHEEVQSLLHAWFHNESITQLSNESDSSDSRLLASELCKRRRVSSDV